MALGQSYRDLLSALDDYGEFGRKQNRNAGVMRGFAMLNESLSAAMERRRRKQENEQQRKDRAAEIEQGRKDRAAEIEQGRQDDAKKEQARVDRELTQTNIDIDKEKIKKDSEKREKDELAAQNLPKVAEIKAMFRQAVDMKDRKSYLDAIDRYTDLDPEYQKKVPYDLYKDEFKSVMEPPKSTANLTPADEEFISSIDQVLPTVEDPWQRMMLVGMKSDAMRNGVSVGSIKELREFMEPQDGGKPTGKNNLTPDQMTGAVAGLEDIRNQGLTIGEPLGSGPSRPMSIIPKDAAVTKWGNEWITRYKTRIEEERALWKLEKNNENSPHNIEDPVVRFNISEEINADMGREDTRTTSEKIVGGKRDGGLEKASKLDRAVEGIVATLTKKNNGVEPTGDQIIQSVYRKARELAPIITAQGITMQEFIEHLLDVYTPA